MPIFLPALISAVSDSVFSVTKDLLLGIDDPLFQSGQSNNNFKHGTWRILPGDSSILKRTFFAGPYFFPLRFIYATDEQIWIKSGTAGQSEDLAIKRVHGHNSPLFIL